MNSFRLCGVRVRVIIYGRRVKLVKCSSLEVKKSHADVHGRSLYLVHEKRNRVISDRNPQFSQASTLQVW